MAYYKDGMFACHKREFRKPCNHLHLKYYVNALSSSQTLLDCRRLCHHHSLDILAYFIIQPDVAAEAGAGRDEANGVSTRMYGSCPKPC